MIYQTHKAFGVAFTATTIVVSQPYWHTVGITKEQPIQQQILQLFIVLLAASVASVLPDVDNLAKRYHIPFLSWVKHRGFTHTIWVVGGIGFLTFTWRQHPLLFPLGWGVTTGYFSHLLGDSFSKAGVAWLYPFQQYKRYPSGAFVVKGYRGIFKPLYRVGHHPKHIHPIPLWWAYAGIMIGWILKTLLLNH